MIHSSFLATLSHPALPDVITYALCAAIVVMGALGVVVARNPVHSALSLVVTLFGIAILFIEQDAPFLAAVQIIVYAGAIVVLFLFVIMFLGVDRRENINEEPLRGQRPLAYVLVAIFFGSLIVLGISAHFITGAHQVTGPINGRITPNLHSPSGEVAQLGKQLFTTYLFAFESTAALLVIAVVGAVVLARRPSLDQIDNDDDAGSTDDAGPTDDAGSTDVDLTDPTHGDAEVSNDQSDKSEVFL